MNGSEKQVKWAEDIKANFLSTTNDVLKEYRQKTAQHQPHLLPIMDLVDADASRFLDETCANDDAKFWIDMYRSYNRQDAFHVLGGIIKTHESKVRELEATK